MVWWPSDNCDKRKLHMFDWSLAKWDAHPPDLAWIPRKWNTSLDLLSVLEALVFGELTNDNPHERKRIWYCMIHHEKKAERWSTKFADILQPTAEVAN